MTRRVATAFVVTLLAAIVSWSLMTVYVTNVLQGDLDNHVLASKMFGVPNALAQHGFRPFYSNERESGWDGQFYFSIANDPFIQADTPAHLDSDAYRYQRIGLPLLAWAVSRVAGQDWVSPTTYYATNLAVVLLATFAAALFFARRGRSGWAVLIWTLSLGVQLTLLNGLPDACADALLLISLVCWFERRLVAYAVFATLAALSREAYILVPAVVAAHEWIRLTDGAGRRLHGAPRRDALVTATRRWLSGTAWVGIVPGLVFVAWQIVIRLRFHHSPSSQAHGILGAPFREWLRYLTRALAGHHPLFPVGFPSYREGVALLLFAGVWVVGVWLASIAWRRAGPDRSVVPIAVATLAISVLYACFGDTVMMHYTGYMKAAGFYFLVAPFLWVKVARNGRVAIAIFLGVVDAYFGYYLFQDRVNQVAGVDYDRYERASQVREAAPQACLRHFDARLALVGFERLYPDTLANRLADHRASVMRVAVTNLSDQPFVATSSRGSVNISYHWMNADGTKVVLDGLRSYLADGPLAPGATVTVPLVVEYPTQPGHYILRLTLVQEGCTWFYNANPSSKLDLDYIIN